MADPAQLAFEDAKGGMNSADPPHRIATNQVARMVNCALVDGLPTTRPGGRVVPLQGDASEFVAVNNVQGSMFFNPAKGQGGIVLSENNAMIAVAVGGRKYVVKIDGRRTGAKAILTDITNGLFTNPQLHLVWWSQWENLLLAQDGQSNAFVWDSMNPAEFSRGYNTVDKPASSIPNGGTVMAYAHGRGVVVANSRFILVGDNLHRTDQSSSSNLKDFVEQVYWATGQYFLPPSAMGNITAAALLPLRNTQHGHADLMLHCEDGIFSLELNVYPRSKWAETQMVKHAILQAGAAGPYAVALFDGDQQYRTRKGMQSLRSAAAESQLEGNPNQTLSNPVGTWLEKDYARWLRFTSVACWHKENRLFVTTGPVVQGRWRWNRGVVVRNFDPAQSQAQTPAAWEGLWTFAPECAGIVQMVGGLFDGEDRMFAWTRGTDRRNRLVEITPHLRHDVLEDGTVRPIRAQVMTRAVDAGKWWERREYTEGLLFLRNIVGVLTWGVWFRTAENPEWHFWNAGRVENPAIGEDLAEPEPKPVGIPLGKLPSSLDGVACRKQNESRSLQFLVRWEGYCQLEGVKVYHTPGDITDDQFKKERLDIHFVAGGRPDYSDFEYSETDEPLWISES